MPIHATYAITGSSANDDVAAGNTTGAWIPLNKYNEPFDTTFTITGSGSPKWSVQHTLSDVQDGTVTPLAFDHSSVSGVNAAIDGAYTEPVVAIRAKMVSAAASGAHSAQFTVLQGGY